MNLENKIKLLRIYLSNTDKFKNEPLYEVIVFAAKRYGLSGATVLKGIMSYGASSNINSIKFWEISEKLPVIIEMIDEESKIQEFFEIIKPYFERIEKGFIITIEDVNVVMYKCGKKKI